MPKLTPAELITVEFAEPGIIFHVPARSTLSKKILHQRTCEEIYDSGLKNLYDLRFLNDDHRNSVFPNKAIWPWPVPEDEAFDDFWEEEDFLDCYPMSSVRPPETKRLYFNEWVEEPILEFSATATYAAT